MRGTTNPPRPPSAQHSIYTLPSRLDRRHGTNGLVCRVAIPSVVVSVLEGRGFIQQRAYKCEVARLRRGGTIVSLYFSGLMIALADDNYGIREVLNVVWQLVEQAEVQS